MALTTADAWLGEDLQRSEAWQYRLTPDDLAELHDALGVARNSSKAMSEMTVDDFPLSALISKIQAWMHEVNDGSGFVLIKGFPVRDYSVEDCSIVYWGLGLYMGDPVSQNTDGDLLGHVLDVGADPAERGVRLYKTRVEQDFHTDGADVIGLFCLRPARQGGVSRIVSSVSVFNEFLERKPHLVERLFEPFPFDKQGQEAPGQDPWFDFPLCNLDGGRLRTFFIPWYIRESQEHAQAPKLTAEQIDCIETIESIANEPRFYLDMHFEPGDMQFLKNAAILHKRTAYLDWDDPGEKRHLLRLWLTGRNFSGGDAMLRRGIKASERANG